MRNLFFIFCIALLDTQYSNSTHSKDTIKFCDPKEPIDICKEQDPKDIAPHIGEDLSNAFNELIEQDAVDDLLLYREQDDQLQTSGEDHGDPLDQDNQLQTTTSDRIKVL